MAAPVSVKLLIVSSAAVAPIPNCETKKLKLFPVVSAPTPSFSSIAAVPDIWFRLPLLKLVKAPKLLYNPVMA